MLDDIDNLLDDAIAAHKANDLSLAMVKYNEILEKDADHADANYNFGLLTKQIGLKNEALIFFKSAIKTNPNQLQYWEAFVETLIKMENFDEVQKALDEAQIVGYSAEKFGHLINELDFKSCEKKLKPQVRAKKVNRGNIKSDNFASSKQKPSLSSKAKQHDRKEDENHNNILVTLKLDQALKLAKENIKSGKNEKAEIIYRDILEKFPKNRKALEGVKAIRSEGRKRHFSLQDPPAHHLQNLFGLLNAGQLDSTLTQASKALLDFPNSAILYNLVGISNQGLGRLDEAVKAFNKALAFSPRNVDAFFNLGNALHDKGQLEKAIKAYQKAVLIEPNYAEAHNNLGIAFKDHGKLEEAKGAYIKAYKIKPDYVDAYNNLGLLLKDQGNFKEAIGEFAKALNIEPLNADVYFNMGIVLKEQGKIEAAKTAYSKAFKINPNFFDAYNNMGILLKDQGKLDEAIVAFKEALKIEPRNADVYFNMGFVFQSHGKLEEAMNAFTKSVSIKPDHVKAWANGANALERWNKIDRLEVWLEKAIKNFKTIPSEIMFFQAKLLWRNKKFNEASALISLIEIEQISDVQRPHYLDLKAKCFDKLKAFDAAFECFSEMNAAIKKSSDYLNSNPEKYFNDVREKLKQIKSGKVFSSGSFTRDEDDITPVFLVGFPRSGTTLLDTILRSHSKVQVAEEKPALKVAKTFVERSGYIDPINQKLPIELIIKSQKVYENELKKHFSEFIPNSIFIDKLPLNMIEAPFIHGLFPDAKFILALRHPLDSILSCWMQNFKLNPAMANMVDLNRIVDFYCITMEIFQISRIKYDLNVHEIKYENLVENFMKETASLLKFLNLNWESEIENYRNTALKRGRINTPSYTQVVQPIYKDASYRWMDYQKYLKQYLDQVQPWISKFGYS